MPKLIARAAPLDGFRKCSTHPAGRSADHLSIIDIASFSTEAGEIIARAARTIGRHRR
jgi:hypothetical protein